MFAIQSDIFNKWVHALFSSVDLFLLKGSLVALLMILLAIMVMMITMAVTCQVFLADDKWVAPPLLQMVSPSLPCPVSQTGITNLKPTSPNDSFIEIIHQSQGDSVSQ